MPIVHSLRKNQNHRKRYTSYTITVSSIDCKGKKLCWVEQSLTNQEFEALICWLSANVNTVYKKNSTHRLNEAAELSS